MTVDLGNIPQWVTAFVACGALLAASISIKSQREIARKRAATDFFTKTEMDRSTLDSHREYTEAVKKLLSMCTDGKMDPQFAGTLQYWAIRDYLNLHELMSVGLEQEVFDDDVCFYFWAGELGRAYETTKPLIDYVQAQPGEEGTYAEFVKIAIRWKPKWERVRSGK